MRQFLHCLTVPLAILSIFLGSAHGQHLSPREQLAEHSAEFAPAVVPVTDGVYVAVGYGLANSILIEGTDGVIIVDAMESTASAAKVKAEFDKLTTKPVKAIIYTHNHYDHIMGASVFAGKTRPDVYAHEWTMREIDHSTRVMRQAIFARSVRQFGVTLAPELFLNAGIGPRLVIDPTAQIGFLPPNKTFSDKLEVEIAGVRIVLLHTPGETDDQICVWLPQKGVACPGDNFYKAFPNLYAIRGTRFRDPAEWVTSLDTLIALSPEHLVPSHTRPLSGRDQIKAVLTDYRDAIKTVLDQTIAGMNQGLTPDELVATVKLPPELASKPYLVEYYGTVPWSVRAIYAGNLGWFNGNATNLFPLPNKERAARVAKLAGGENALRQNLEAAIKAEDFPWACELADHVLALHPDDQSVRELKAVALTALGEKQTSANGRNYYLTQAQELRRQTRRSSAEK